MKLRGRQFLLRKRERLLQLIFCQVVNSKIDKAITLFLVIVRCLEALVSFLKFESIVTGRPVALLFGGILGAFRTSFFM